MKRESSNLNNFNESHHYRDDINRNNRGGYSNLNQNDNEINVNIQNTESRTRQSPSIFSRYILNPIKRLATFLCPRGDQFTEEENRIFSDLPEKVNNFNSFCTIIKSKIGIIILYTEQDLDFFTNIVNNLKREEHTMDTVVNFLYYI
jgi:hypothetical protein